jgi:hypothetical protein
VESSEASGLNCVLRLVCNTAALQFIFRRRRGDETQIEEKLETPHVVSYLIEVRKSFSRRAKARSKASWFFQFEKSREMTQQDIALLFRHGDDKDHFDRFGFGIDRNGNIHGAQGVVFAIKPLGISPEAKFTKGFMLNDRDWFYGPKIPKDTILRFGANGEEYILPGQESKPCKSLSELLSR